MAYFRKPGLSAVIYITVILLLTVTAVSLGIMLYRSGTEESYYDKKCGSFSVQNANLSKGQIIFIGDSITDLYPLDDYYSDLPLAVYNRGIGGDTTGGVLNRLDVSLFDLAPSRIVLMIGTNDINGSNTDGEILARYEDILHQIREKLPSSEIYCMSIIPQNSDRGFSAETVDSFNKQILRLNSKIKSLCESLKLNYVDLFASLSDENDRLIKDYSDDGLHLNSKGFELWTKVLKPMLEN